MAHTAARVDELALVDVDTVVARPAIRLASGVGLVEGSIEDAAGDRDPPLFDMALAVERVAAAVEAARALPDDPVDCSTIPALCKKLGLRAGASPTSTA